MNNKDHENQTIDVESIESKKTIWIKLRSKILPRKPFDGYCLIAAFCLPFLIMLGVYACLGKHPFGNGSVLTLDLQAQYVYYYEAIRRLLVEGGSWLYSWQRTLGGEFMGIVAYYMASPFNLILLLFPKRMIVDAIMMIQLTKVGAMGLTFAYYLRKTRKTSDMQTVSFSMMYALCAFSVVQLMNPMWLDAAVFLPLLVLGIESMIREKKFVLYTVSLVAVFVTNYYMGYMCAIFTFIYFLYYYFLVCDELPKKEVPQQAGFLSRILHTRGFETLMRFAVFTVVALLISAFVLLCAWYSLGFGKTEFSTTNFWPNLRFDFLDLFVKMLPGSYDTVRTNGLPMIYCGMLALIALPLFYMSPVISRKKKLLASGVLTILILSFCINTIDLVWHGFSTPNWLNYRYSYVFSFFVLLMAVDAVRGIRKIRFQKILTVGVWLFVLILIVQKLDYSFAQNNKTNTLDDAKCILLSLVLVIAYMIALYFAKTDRMANAGAFALAVIVCVEMFSVSLINVDDVESDVGTVRYDNYLSESGKTEYYDGYVGSIRRIESVVNEVLEKDKGFYRMESTIYRRLGGVNEQMAFGFNGISHSTSTLNKPIINLMNKLGYSSTQHWTKYIGGTPVSDALLGIKYVITKDNAPDTNFYTVAASGTEGYKYIPSEAKIYALQNVKALPVAYGVSPTMREKTDGFLNPPYYTALDLQNRLINAMLSGVMPDPNVIRSIRADVEGIGCTYSIYSHDHKYTVNGDSRVAANNYYSVKPDANEKNPILRFSFEAPTDGDIYAHFPGILFTGMSTECDLYVNGSKISGYFTNETWVVQNLGTFEKGDNVKVELRFKNGDLYISRASGFYFYYVDYAAMNRAFSQLESASMYVEEHGNDYLKGTIDIPAGQELIFTSIPYDEGWRVYIDGKRVEICKTLDSLLAVETTVGFHDIEFRYLPNCVVYGGILSLIGVLAFALLIAWSMSRRLRRVVIREDADDSSHFFYHRGDELHGWLLEGAEEGITKSGEAADDMRDSATPSLADQSTQAPISEEMTCCSPFLSTESQEAPSCDETEEK